MRDKLRALGRLWAYSFAISLLTMIVYHAIPAFGTLRGDLEIGLSGLRLPIVSCGLLSLAAVGLWAYVNRGKS